MFRFLKNQRLCIWGKVSVLKTSMAPKKKKKKGEEEKKRLCQKIFFLKIFLYDIY